MESKKSKGKPGLCEVHLFVCLKHFRPVSSIKLKPFYFISTVQIEWVLKT